MANTTIEQFRKMANDDPSNVLGHFSLARALADAGELEEAVTTFQRVLQLDPNISRAYQLLGGVLLKLNRRDEAIVQYTRGVTIAHERGDMMPKADMIKELTALGAPIPQLAAKAEVKVGEGEVLCQRCKRTARKQPSQPFSNAQGKLIYENICNDCWREWIGMGTKVINELRLPLSDPQAQKIFDQHMMEFLNLK
jgi:Fe-S cluster biosynthesis and repair protein YggX